VPSQQEIETFGKKPNEPTAPADESTPNASDIFSQYEASLKAEYGDGYYWKIPNNVLEKFDALERSKRRYLENVELQQKKLAKQVREGGHLKTRKEQLASKNFNQWIAGNKIVNPDGTPKIVYHGTLHDVIDFESSFTGVKRDKEVGIWLTSDAAYADWLNDKRTGRKIGVDRGNVMELFVSIKNPKTIDILSVANQLADTEGVAHPESGIEAQELLSGSIGWDEIVSEWANEAKREGHDGLTLENFDDNFYGGLTTAYIAFEPSQIRTASPNEPAAPSASAFDAQSAFEKHGGVGDIDESKDISAKSQAFADMAEAEGYTVAGRGDKYVTLSKDFGETDDGYTKQAIIKVRVSDHSNVNRGHYFGEAGINIAPDDGYDRDTFDSALQKIKSAYVNDDLDTVIPNEAPEPLNAETETSDPEDIPVTEIEFDFQTVAELTKQFVIVLRSDVGQAVYQQIVALNKTEADPSICHSHDFIDANMVMAKAFAAVTKIEVDLRSSSQTQLWNRSWALAVSDMKLMELMPSYTNAELTTLARQVSDVALRNYFSENALKDAKGVLQSLPTSDRVASGLDVIGKALRGEDYSHHGLQDVSVGLSHLSGGSTYDGEMSNYIANTNDVTWIGTSDQAVATRPDGTKVAVRHGSEVAEANDVFERLARGEMGDDLPIVMEGLGCNYDAACDAVFGGKFEVASAMLRQAVKPAQGPVVKNSEAEALSREVPKLHQDGVDAQPKTSSESSPSP